ncbi:MAG: stage II sporulation protein D [Clostridia bacterium]|nr:stage II sporulation protein D [Clostridia bacterium]
MKYTLQITLALMFLILLMSVSSIGNDEVRGIYIKKTTAIQTDMLQSSQGRFECIKDAPEAQTSSEQMNKIYLFDKDEGRMLVTVREYLVGVLAAEMPASYALEALKAQAVASRTYLFYKMINGGCSRHDGCAICTASGHCQGYLSRAERETRWGENFEKYEQKLVEAVKATENQFLIHNGRIINAMYHSSSCGMTESYSSVYGGNNQYLLSVSTPEGVEHTLRSKSIEAEEILKIMKEKYPEAGITKEDVMRIRITSKTQSGRVSRVRIGSITLSGGTFAGLIGLKSTDFSFTCSGSRFDFIYHGSGHGVGMSQVGASIMARESDYKSILMHYYTSVELTNDPLLLQETLSYLTSGGRAEK